MTAVCSATSAKLMSEDRHLGFRGCSCKDDMILAEKISRPGEIKKVASAENSTCHGATPDTRTEGGG